jgi:SAM-dependent methyltransferase
MSARAASGAATSANKTAKRAKPIIGSSLSAILLLWDQIRSYEPASDKRTPPSRERMTENSSISWAAYYTKLRDRPPRRTLLTALDRFGPPAPGALAVDLGCGDGRDTIEMLRRGWQVVAVDAEPEALRMLQTRELPAGSVITPIVARMEDVPLPLGLSLVNSSFAMPLCEPDAFHCLWSRIREALPAGGRFSGQWFGPRDSWVGRPGLTFVSRDEAMALLSGFELELFDEEEADGITPRGNHKHWHIFHIVARKR